MRFNFCGSMKMETVTARAAYAVNESATNWKKNKLRILSFGHFWTKFGCFLDLGHTISMPWRTQKRVERLE